MVDFMRELFPEIEGSFDNKIPIYKGDGYFITFATRKKHVFSKHQYP